MYRWSAASAARTPIEALQNRISDVPVPSGMIGAGEHYALEVTGDSMINTTGILDGDTVIVREYLRRQHGRDCRRPGGRQ